MTSASGSSFKRIFTTYGLLAAAWVLFAGCVTSPLDGAKQKVGAAPAETTMAPARKIAPPPGAAPDKRKATQSAVDKLLAEMPEEARDSDGELVLPLETNAASARHSTEEQRRREVRAIRTDSEVIGAQRSLDERYAKELGSIERELGVEGEEGGSQAPSFTLTVQRIKDLFKAKDYEEALIETNESLRHYAKSAQLLTMKGTIHQRLQQVELALAAYERAFEMEPTRKLQAQIDYLRAVIADRAALQRYREGMVIPGEVSTYTTPKNGGE